MSKVFNNDLEWKNKFLNENYCEIFFAGGCFWGVEKFFKFLPGVVYTSVGYANGFVNNPTYEIVCNQQTGFIETCHVVYDNKLISLTSLTLLFFEIIDPFSINKQGHDIGHQYQSGVFYTNENDLHVLESIFLNIQLKLNHKVNVLLENLTNYYLAEEYHQNYLTKNPNGYCHISNKKINNLINNFKSKQPILQFLNNNTYKNNISIYKTKEELTNIQYEVTQNKKTEPPFTGKYNQFFKKGIYVDVISKQPLFLSADKFNSDCGWPSFSKPIDESLIINQIDNSYNMIRVEVKSKLAKSHLGHVFNDGPSELGGLRYCINSAALEFVAYEELESKGYGYLKKLFAKNN